MILQGNERFIFGVVVLCCCIFLSQNSKVLLGVQQSQQESVRKAAAAIRGESFVEYTNPLGIPMGEAEALPSIRVNEEDEEEEGEEEEGKNKSKEKNKKEEKKKKKSSLDRGIYGGKGDKGHLGGFTDYDGEGVSPMLWKVMMENWGVKSVLDVGCGRGISTLWFFLQGLDVLCLEGSHDAIQKTFLPSPQTQIIEHDFARGPYWPRNTYDAVWSVEFLEHVGVEYQYNYLQAFRKAALIFVSHSRWGGWHHVEVHESQWWIQKFQSQGFLYSKEMTDIVHSIVQKEPDYQDILGPNGKPFRAQHLYNNMHVFINPMVAALPQHQHLFFEHGCYGGDKDGTILHVECGHGNAKEETLRPKSFYPLTFKIDKHDQWVQQIKSNITTNQTNKQKKKE